MRFSASPVRTTPYSGSTNHVERPPFLIGDRVFLANSKSSGTVHYYGPINYKAGEWVGLVLDENCCQGGRNDGSVDGTRYFQCAPNRGLFIKPKSCELIQPDPLPPPPVAQHSSITAKVVKQSSRAAMNLTSPAVRPRSREQQHHEESQHFQPRSTPMSAFNSARDQREYPYETPRRRGSAGALHSPGLGIRGNAPLIGDGMGSSLYTGADAARSLQERALSQQTPLPPNPFIKQIDDLLHKDANGDSRRSSVVAVDNNRENDWATTGADTTASAETGDASEKLELLLEETFVRMLQTNVSFRKSMTDALNLGGGADKTAVRINALEAKVSAASKALEEIAGQVQHISNHVQLVIESRAPGKNGAGASESEREKDEEIRKLKDALALVYDMAGKAAEQIQADREEAEEDRKQKAAIIDDLTRRLQDMQKGTGYAYG